ncbi:MAG: 3'-5' exonuclease [Polyangiaceae bacterium]|nr:3'-5' exonuclease [Polyangiaceae bacterium]
MKGSMDGGGCFPTGRHYPGIAHLLSVSFEGLAKEWPADTPMTDIPYASLDTETTGRSADADRVIEVGIVIFRDGEPTEQKGWLIQPERPIPPDATAIHGITDADLEGKPIFSEVMPEILETLQGVLPLAYNASFDRGFLMEELKRAGTPEELPPAFRRKVRWADPLTWARELQKEHRSRALGDVCERLGISLENAHRATDDADAAGRVMAAFLKDQRVPPTYGAFMKEQERLDKQFAFERQRWRR